MISSTPREWFSPKFEVVSCFIEHEWKILLLQRQWHKPQPHTYGVPAGKVDNGEDPHQAILRELKEETWVNVNEVSYFTKLFVQYLDYEFIYHIFSAQFDERPEVVINHDEHQHYTWLPPHQALELDLIQDEDHCIKLFYKID